MDDDQQFCLRWNNHQSTLVSVFDTLLEKGMHVDCTLAAEGQFLKAHKVVLSACSPYFESVLAQQFDKHPIIILKDVKYAELRAMMDYMYRGEVNISQDQLAALLKAAESLQIKGLSDNKPSRPPSRPAPPLHAPHPPHAHPPRAPSPPPQARDGSVDSREGSVSPTRRRKKPRRLSSEGVPPPALAPLAPPLPAGEPQNNGDEPPCKEEVARDGVEDLTIDEEADEAPPVTHNDVVRNFQWHMERSQDEIMNSSDSVRDTQEPPLELLKKKRGYITRGVLRSFLEKEGYLKSITEKEACQRVVVKEEPTEPTEKKRRGRPKGIKNKPKELKPLNAIKVKKEPGNYRGAGEKKFVCSLCNQKYYKYLRNKLRHEKFECRTGPQFGCVVCSKRYSQKKTLVSHMKLKHDDVHLPLEIKCEDQ